MTTYHQLLNQLDHLKLDRVRQLLPEFLDEHADISLVEGLHELLSEELREREALLQERRLKKAHLPYEKRVMDFDFQFQPKINKAEILDLHTLRFLDKRIAPPQPRNPIITAGSPAEAYLQMYDPRRDSEALKTHPEQFEKLRGDYPLRREKDAYTYIPK